MKSKAFTLIELLVVISIIGVISSIVLVSFSGSRDKARLAKAQNFDAQISHALGAYAVGIWRFEEGGGITLHDESGYGNDGTFVGNPTPVFPAGVYSGTTALEFDGSNDYVDCGSWFNYNTFSISMWLKPGTSQLQYADIMDNNHTGSRSWVIQQDGSTTNYYGFRPVTNPAGAGFVNFTLSANVWQHLVVIKNTSQIQAYVNGQLIDSKQSGAIVVYDGTQYLRLSRWGGGNRYWNGSIDNVRIYNEALSSAQIQQHYAAGAPSHGIAVK